jgi:hypothetical protein
MDPKKDARIDDTTSTAVAPNPENSSSKWKEPTPLADLQEEAAAADEGE